MVYVFWHFHAISSDHKSQELTLKSKNLLPTKELNSTKDLTSTARSTWTVAMLILFGIIWRKNREVLSPMPSNGTSPNLWLTKKANLLLDLVQWTIQSQKSKKPSKNISNHVPPKNPWLFWLIWVFYEDLERKPKLCCSSSDANQYLISYKISYVAPIFKDIWFYTQSWNTYFILPPYLNHYYLVHLHHSNHHRSS